MNGKFDEKLAQLAFGDLPPSEAARVESVGQTDPEAARALLQYQRMKADLALLRDIPEDQLSKDRLRHAILAQGLKPARKNSPSWGWLWMPAAACMLAFGLVMYRPRSHSEPQIVLNAQTPAPKLGDIALKFKPEHPTGIAPQVQVPSIKGPLLADNRGDNHTRSWDTFDRYSHRRAAYRHSRKRNDPNEDLIADVLLDPRGWDGQPSGGAPQKASVTTVSAPTRVASNDDTSSSSQPPLVLIDQDKDSSTGANTATEVGSASNVLVGG